jgi:starch synthase
LTADKGFELLRDEMPAMLENHPVCLAILGQGEPSFVRICEEWMKRWPGRVSYKNAFDRDLSHRVIAGADMLLMPSKVEPCGLAQLFALRYGTVPVAHATGGIRDTIQPINAVGGEGTGYLFQPFAGEHLQAALGRAMRHFAQSATWSGTMRRAMAQDNSWTKSAAAYRAVYARLLKTGSAPT